MPERKGGGKTVISELLMAGGRFILLQTPWSASHRRAKKEALFQKMMAQTPSPVILDEAHVPRKVQNSSLSGAHVAVGRAETAEYVGTWPLRQNPVEDHQVPSVQTELSVTEPLTFGDMTVTEQLTKFVSAPRGNLIPPATVRFPAPHGNQLGRLAQRRHLEKQYRIMYQQASRRKKLALKKYAKTNSLEECIAYAKRLRFWYF